MIQGKLKNVQKCYSTFQYQYILNLWNLIHLVFLLVNHPCKECLSRAVIIYCYLMMLLLATGCAKLMYDLTINN